MAKKPQPPTDPPGHPPEPGATGSTPDPADAHARADTTETQAVADAAEAPDADTADAADAPMDTDVTPGPDPHTGTPAVSGARGAPDTAGDGPGGGTREYRMAELAELAGITTRTLRFYRERKLLSPPRREGRIAWYNEHHLARLRTISALLARGHTLGGIMELLNAFEHGRDARSPAEALGLDPALVSPFAEESPVRLTPEELADHYQGEVTVENLATSLDIGYVAVDGDEFVHVSPRLLNASAALVRTGIPLSAVLEAGRTVRSATDTMAESFAGLFRTHLLPKQLPDAADGIDTARVNAVLEELRPLAKQVVEAELALALDRRVRAELENWLQQDHGHPPPDGDEDGAGAGKPEPGKPEPEAPEPGAPESG